MRRALHVLSIALITAGAVILIDVGMTLAWEEPLSTIYSSIQQGKAEDELADITESFLSMTDLEDEARSERAIKKQVAKLADRYADEHVSDGKAIGRIVIDGIDLDRVVVEGTATSALQKGPGRYSNTAFPGQGKTVGIAGHRTTYGAPFRHIDGIEDGDEIVLEMPYGRFAYEVQKHEIVDPTDVEIVDDVGYERLVLTACHPLYSAAQRYAVFARLTEARPATGEDG